MAKYFPKNYPKCPKHTHWVPASKPNVFNVWLTFILRLIAGTQYIAHKTLAVKK